MCRRLHVVGQLVTILTLIYALSFQAWFLLLCVPFVVYPFAWSGHFFFEKNTPAAFSKPIWAKASDWIMLKDWLLGNIER
tara:strand:- start:598 stop:837 length:240 start_codon:yes stop_codon:yes gene_type:complete